MWSQFPPNLTFFQFYCCEIIIMRYVVWQVPKFIDQITSRKKRYSHLAVGWHKSQITVCHVKIQTPPITLYFKKILIGFLYFTETKRSKLSDTVYLFLVFYGSTTLQSRLFLKNIENFLLQVENSE